MNIKASQRANGKQLAGHLASNENESVRVTGSRFVSTQKIAGAIAEMESVAAGSRAQKPLFHVQYSPEPGQPWDDAKKRRMFELYEQVQGLNGLQFIEVQHQKHGRIHWHRVYNRVDPITLTARNLSWTRVKNERVCRQLEVEFGHRIIGGKHNRAVVLALTKGGERLIAEKLRHLVTAAPAVVVMTHAEAQQSKRLPLDQVRDQLAQAWLASDRRQSLEAALEDRGFLLAQGDKAPIVVDSAGRTYPLLRSINAGRKLAGLKPIRKAQLAERLPGHMPRLSEVCMKHSDRGASTRESHRSRGECVVAVQSENKRLRDVQGLYKKRVRAKEAEDLVIVNSSGPSERQLWRQRLLSDLYGDEIVASNLSKYWKVYRLHDGSLRLENSSGRVFDRGDKIAVDADGGRLFPAVSAALKLAQIKNWKEIKVSGSRDFKEIAFELAIRSCISVKLDDDEDRLIYQAAMLRVQQSTKGTIESPRCSMPQKKNNSSSRRSPGIS